MLSKYLNGHILTTEDCRFNQRKKLYINQHGELLAVEVMTSTSKCFSDGGNELSEMSVKRKRHQDNQKLIEQMHYELYNEPVQPVVKENPIERSKRRAKKQIKDLILCGNFDTFVTLTLDGEKIDRQDYGAVIKKLMLILTTVLSVTACVISEWQNDTRKAAYTFTFLSTARRSSWQTAERYRYREKATD